MSHGPEDNGLIQCEFSCKASVKCDIKTDISTTFTDLGDLGDFMEMENNLKIPLSNKNYLTLAFLLRVHLLASYASTVYPASLHSSLFSLSLYDV